MDYKLLNELLSDLRNFETNKNVERIEFREIDDEFFTIYKVKSEPNLYIKVLTYCDSYSDNEIVYKVEFVKAKEVQKIEYINID